MLAVERRDNILETLRSQGIVTVLELSKSFAVTEETIRRDLKKLETTNGVVRTYGGAYISRTVHSDIPVGIREGIYLEGKEAIADLAEQFIADGETIILDSSTTSIHIAKRLRKRNNIIVITNGIKIVNILSDVEGVKVICTGGTLRPRQLSFTGPAAVKSLCTYYADKAFVSCTGIDLQNGLTDSDEQEAEIRKMMLQQAQEKIIIADNTKFGKTSFAAIAPVSGADCIFTDMEPDETWRAELERMKIRYSFRGQ
jgi:DeoR/GlpR family transcriptional regulator of sugar metabolism